MVMLHSVKVLCSKLNYAIRKTSILVFYMTLVTSAGNAVADDALSLDDARNKQLQEIGLLLPDPMTIRTDAKSEFSKPVLEQDPSKLEDIAKAANKYSNLVDFITDEYNDYLRDNSRYDFVVEEVRAAPIVNELLDLDSEFKTMRNKAYLNMGLIALQDGNEMEAFLLFRDAFRLSAFTCSTGTENCIRYQAEQQMKSLLGIDGGSYVHWQK